MDYIQLRNIKESLKMMRKRRGRATFVAGGTNVIPDMRAKVLRPDVLIDLSHLKSLSYVKEDKKRIRIGGLTTISALASSQVIQKYASILSEAANQLGNPLVRNRATIAGNLADASPAADTAVPLLALEAMVVTEGDAGKRRHHFKKGRDHQRGFLSETKLRFKDGLFETGTSQFNGYLCGKPHCPRGYGTR
jgi:carbon-monoxide dehydrogenase medium subunit